MFTNFCQSVVIAKQKEKEMSDSDQSEESLYSDSDKDLGNASDIPILSEESEIEDDSGSNIAISSPQYIPG